MLTSSTQMGTGIKGYPNIRQETSSKGREEARKNMCGKSGALRYTGELLTILLTL